MDFGKFDDEFYEMADTRFIVFPQFGHTVEDSEVIAISKFVKHPMSFYYSEDLAHSLNCNPYPQILYPGFSSAMIRLNLLGIDAVYRVPRTCVSIHGAAYDYPHTFVMTNKTDFTEYKVF